MFIILFLWGLVVLGGVCAETIQVPPGGSIQEALEKAQPGDTVSLSAGKYNGFVSVRDGSADARITISGSRDSIVNGGESSRMIEINHSYHTLDGFTVDGKTGPGDKAEDYVDKCIFVLGTRKPELIRANGEEYESSLDGLIVHNMFITRCGAECLRLRSFITNAEVVGNRFKGCGVHDFKFPSNTVNGEVMYIGTSSNQWNDGKNSRSGPDLSKHIWIHNNDIVSEGNECVDVKEGTTDVLVEYNVCSEQKDPNSAGLDSRTDDIIFRYNEIFNCEGAGVRIGGHTIDGKTYGVHNEVYGNVFSNNKFSSIKTETGDDHNMCENECKGECSSRGKTGDRYQDIGAPCSETREIKWVSEGRVMKNVKRESKTMEVEVEILQEKRSSEECSPVFIKSVEASGDDGNVPKNAVDGKSVTRWSANKKGAWLELGLREETSINSIEMSFFKGDQRQQFFDIYADGKPILMKQSSSGNSLGLERFNFETPVSAHKVTLFGQGNSVNDWNSIVDIIVCGDVTVAHDVQDEDECDTFALDISSIKSSSDDGNRADAVLGKDHKRWSCNTSPCELLLTLKEPSYVAEFEFAVYKGNTRQQSFDLEVKTPSGWQDVVVDGVSAKTNGVQSIDVDTNQVDQLKFVGYGNDISSWTSILSVEVIGCN